MARPRAASDEEIIAVAEQLAQEVGWQKVYAKTVHEHMSVGGSLSTFSRPIKAWRASKEAEDGAQNVQAGEIVEDRASVLDDGLDAIADTLKKLRQTVNNEIDRAVADERRKSERLRADDRIAHQKVTEDLREQVKALTAEIDELVTEAQTEADRADQAENRVRQQSEDLDLAHKQISTLEIEARKVSGLTQELNAANAEIKKVTAEAEVRYEQVRRDAERQIEKSEARETAAQEIIKARDAKIDKVERDLSSVREELATAQGSLNAARAESTSMDEKLKSAQNEIAELKSRIENEVSRADSAWDQVRDLREKITAPTESKKGTQKEEEAAS